MIDRNKHFPVRHFGGHWPIGHWPRLEAVIHYVRSLLLMNSPASIVRGWLVNQLLGSLPSTGAEWPIFVSHLPDGEGLDDAICVYDTGPVLHGETPDGKSVEHHQVLVTVRSNFYTRGRDKITGLISALDQLKDETLDLGVHRYEVVNAVQLRTDTVGRDAQRRSSFGGLYAMNIYRLVVV